MSVLEGIKVISFNHFLLGPLGAQFLADQGTISDRDLELIQYTENPQEAWELIEGFHRRRELSESGA